MLKVPVPGGLKVNSKRLCGFTVTFRPGYSYNNGDTLDCRWNNPEPSNKLNTFRVMMMDDTAKFYDNSFNVSLSFKSKAKYFVPNYAWRTRFIPGNAEDNFTRHLYSAFHISYLELPLILSDKYETEENTVSNIYPNPAAGNATLSFTLPKTENVKVQIYNVVGQLISIVANCTYPYGKHTLNINTERMKPGVYFYTFTAGNFTQTKKFSILK